MHCKTKSARFGGQILLIAGSAFLLYKIPGVIAIANKNTIFNQTNVVDYMGNTSPHKALVFREEKRWTNRRTKLILSM